MARILVVEDNHDLAFGLQQTLQFEGHQVTLADNGADGLACAASFVPDLIILDLMLPDQTGYEVLSELRASGSLTRVLILTARSQEADVVMGFDSGADDFVTKPFSPIELQARVRALLRRDAATSKAPLPLRFGEVEVHGDRRQVVRAGETVELSPKEYDLLDALLRRDGAIASREELLKEVWGYQNAEIPTRTVDVHISELRKKLEADPGSPHHILTVRKAGYRLQR